MNLRKEPPVSSKAAIGIVESTHYHRRTSKLRKGDDHSGEEAHAKHTRFFFGYNPASSPNLAVMPLCPTRCTNGTTTVLYNRRVRKY